MRDVTTTTPSYWLLLLHLVDERPNSMRHEYAKLVPILEDFSRVCIPPHTGWCPIGISRANNGPSDTAHPVMITVPALKVVPCDKWEMILGIENMRSLAGQCASMGMGSGCSPDITLLNLVAVVLSPNPHLRHVRDLVLGHECGSYGTRPVKPFPVTPLRLVELGFSRCQIIGRGVPCRLQSDRCEER